MDVCIVRIRYPISTCKGSQGQALADLIADRVNTDVSALFVRAWAMFFDGSACDDGYGVGILLVSPQGATYSFSIRMNYPCTNNLVVTPWHIDSTEGFENLLDKAEDVML